MSWRDGSLRLVEDGPDEVVASPDEGCGRWRVTVSYLGRDAQLVAFGQAGHRDPVEAIGGEIAGEEIFVGADRDFVRVRVNRKDVEGVGRAQAEALALPDGEAVDPLMMSDDFAGCGDEIAGEIGHLFFLFVEVSIEEGAVVAVGDEAYLLRVGLLGDVKALVFGDLADGGLLHLAEGEEGAGELGLREAEEEVGLVLRVVGRTGEDPALARFVEVVAGVVASGDAVGSDLAGGEEELIELEVVVAEGAGDGRASVEVLVDEGADDVGLEAILLVYDVVGDSELLGYGSGVVDVVEGATAALHGLGHAVLAGEAALVP